MSNNKPFSEQLRASKRWNEFNVWYNNKYYKDFAFISNGTIEYADGIEFISKAPFAFQSGVLLQFLREKRGLSVEFGICNKCWEAFVWHIESEEAIVTKSFFNYDPDTALQGAILEAFNL